MGVSRKKALQYAEKIISVPRSRVLVTLRHGQEGVTLLHGGRAVAKVFVNRSGIRAAAFMARALGTKVPPLGRAV
ncbi:MAG: hypothetical protein QME77_14190 [bacterium]|nr:hypothetical protein [bacterium]